MARRNTTDDRNELTACMETGNISKASKLAAGELPAFGKCGIAVFLCWKQWPFINKITRAEEKK